jgi:membrane fusion protein, copper/silver efflux system
MKTLPRLILLVCGIAICGTGAHALWRMSATVRSPGPARKVLYYQDSMHPWIKSDQPGKCTVCGMGLTPILAGQSGFGLREGMVGLSSNSATVLNVQTEVVSRQPLSRTLRVAGTLEPNEARKTIIAAPSPGRIQASAVEFAGMEVEQGQMLITLFSPELVQRRAFLRTVGGDASSVGNGLVRASADSNPYLGDIVAPQSGVVVERNVYPGQYVVEGEKLLTIVDASVLWFRFDVYEQQLPWLKLGQTIDVTVAAVPGKKFPAVISFIEPTLSEATRTVKVRADILNPVVATNGGPQRLLRFGLYAEGSLSTEIRDGLAVPRTAILFPGGAAYAYVSKGNGVYERRRVQLGRQGDSRWEVLHGLEAGDHVVTSGNVLIDAQAQFNQGSDADETGSGGVAAAEPGEEPMDTAMSPAASADSPHSMAAASAAMQPGQRRALAEFLTVADGISRALAADSLGQLKTNTGALPGAVSSLAKALGDNHPWHPLLKHIQEFATWPVPTDLAAARRTLLPFSTRVVELVQLARGTDEEFRSLKVYHCPMAPKPGLWFQAKGPLRNPFYGAEMLTCGNEVPVPAGAPGATRANGSALAQTRPQADSAAGMSDKPPTVAATTQAPMARMGTNAPSRGEVAPHPSVDHTRVMSELMSPGAERQMLRRASILKGMETEAAAAGTPDAVAPEVARAARRQQALASFVDVADGIGQALAGDDLALYYERIAALPTVFTLLRQEFATNQPLHTLVQHAVSAGLPLASAGQWRTTKDLAEARALFLPFSTTTVDLAKALKKEGEPFTGLKLYHCPTAAKPELWMQTKGPPRNPFQGPKEPVCGEEAKP